jgi:hypothetical protein
VTPQGWISSGLQTPDAFEAREVLVAGIPTYYNNYDAVIDAIRRHPSDPERGFKAAREVALCPGQLYLLVPEAIVYGDHRGEDPDRYPPIEVATVNGLRWRLGVRRSLAEAAAATVKACLLPLKSEHLWDDHVRDVIAEGCVAVGHMTPNLIAAYFEVLMLDTSTDYAKDVFDDAIKLKEYWAWVRWGSTEGLWGPLPELITWEWWERQMRILPDAPSEAMPAPKDWWEWVTR